MRTNLHRNRHVRRPVVRRTHDFLFTYGDLDGCLNAAVAAYWRNRPER